MVRKHNWILHTVLFQKPVVVGNELLYFADICAGPGGFSEYVLWRRKGECKGFGLTLRQQNDFKLEDFFAGPSEMFEPHYGESVPDPIARNWSDNTTEASVLSDDLFRGMDASRRAGIMKFTKLAVIAHPASKYQSPPALHPPNPPTPKCFKKKILTSDQGKVEVRQRWHRVT